VDLDDVGHCRFVGVRAPVRRVLSGVEVRVDRHVVAEPLRHGDHGLDLDAFDGAVTNGTLLATPNRVQHVVVVEPDQSLGDMGQLLEDREFGQVVHGHQLVPQLRYDAIDLGPLFGDRQGADEERKVGVRGRPNE